MEKKNGKNPWSNGGRHEEVAYREARERQLAMLREGFDLGTEGRIAWRREDLYTRK